MKEIVAGFKDASEPKKIQSAGIHVTGVKYMVIKAEDRSIYGMKVRLFLLLSCCARILPILIDGMQGKTGVIIVKTTQAILIAHYPEGVPATIAANTVEQLADYLMSVGY